MRNQMPQRSSPLLFAVTFLTAGFFAPIWVYLMNRDIQKVAGSHFPYLGSVALTASAYPVLFAVHAYAVNAGLPLIAIIAVRAPLVVAWLALGWLFFGGIVAVGRYLRKEGVDVPGGVTLILLLSVVFLSLALLQRGLNAVASRNRSARATTAGLPNA